MDMRASRVSAGMKGISTDIGYPGEGLLGLLERFLGYLGVTLDGTFGLSWGISGWVNWAILGDSGWVFYMGSMDFQIGFSWNILDYLGQSWTVF